MNLIRRGWLFQKNLRDAYAWHRCTGEERRLRALGGTWRTALILTFNDDPEFIWVRAST